MSDPCTESKPRQAAAGQRFSFAIPPLTHPPVVVDGRGRGEAVLVQGLHEGELPEGREAGHVEPRGGLAVLQIVALLGSLVLLFFWGWVGGR